MTITEYLKHVLVTELESRLDRLDELIPPWLREVVGDPRLKRLGYASRESAERLRKLTEPPDDDGST